MIQQSMYGGMGMGMGMGMHGEVNITSAPRTDF